MFIATLFIISQTQKHPKCLLTEKWIRKLGAYTYLRILVSLKQDGNSAIYDNMGGP